MIHNCAPARPPEAARRAKASAQTDGRRKRAGATNGKWIGRAHVSQLLGRLARFAGCSCLPPAPETSTRWPPSQKRA